MSDNESVRVKDVMTDNYHLVDGLMMTDQALAKMKETGAVVLIVDKRNENDEYGIVLLSDIAREVLAVSRAPERVNIYEIMSKPVVSVDPHMYVRYCARLFNQFGLSVAPVKENYRGLGIICSRALGVRGR